MKVVLFLGAGFSVPFGYPAMESFLSAARDSSKLNPEDKSFLDELAVEARRANSFLESSHRNIEAILSFAVMGQRLGLPDQGDRARRIRNILHQVYAQPSDPDEYWERYRHLGRFLGMEFGHGSPHSLSIITTNYDINAECAMSVLGVKADPGFVFVVPQNRSQVLGSLYSVGGTPLYKLHGSVNWYGPNEQEQVTVEDRIVPVMGGPSASRLQGGHLPFVCAANYQCDLDPLIVPPSFLKPDLPLPLRTLWRKSAEALGSANLVVFVGYSFPPSDSEMKYFLARAMMDNVSLDRIVVADLRADELVTRLRARESGFGSHFKELLDPVNGNWIENRLAK